MAALRATLGAGGLDDVATYRQSGNAVFGTTGPGAGLPGFVAGLVRADLSLDVAVIVRSSAELDLVVGDNPLQGRSGDPAKLHVTFFGSEPRAGRIEALLAEADDDGVAVVGREAYLHCPSGYGRTRLTNTFLERRLGVTATTRNWRTVRALAEMAREPGARRP